MRTHPMGSGLGLIEWDEASFAVWTSLLIPEVTLRKIPAKSIYIFRVNLVKAIRKKGKKVIK